MAIPVRAVDYSSANGTQTYAGAGTGRFLGDLRSTFWVGYDRVNFGQFGASEIEASVSMIYSAVPRPIAIRLDSPTGKVIGTMNIADTGGWTTFTTQTTPIETTTGVHDVYFVPVGTGLSGYGGIDWFRVVPTATQRVEAEQSTASYGTRPYAVGTGVSANYWGAGNWKEYANVDFGAGGLTTFSASVGIAPVGAGTQLAVRLDSPTGPLIGTLVTTSTGGWYTFSTQSTALTTTPTGKHSVYLVSNKPMYLDWFTFS
jgi:hypothetical protein